MGGNSDLRKTSEYDLMPYEYRSNNVAFTFLVIHRSFGHTLITKKHTFSPEKDMLLLRITRIHASDDLTD